MKRLTHALTAAYVLGTGVMIRAAVISHEHGSTGWTATYLGAAVIFALGIAHHYVIHDELRAARARLERAARPPGKPRPAIDEVIAVALAGACCDTWWTSAGADHEPTCPNHQHRSNA